jgi:hypothetical protein
MLMGRVRFQYGNSQCEGLRDTCTLDPDVCKSARLKGTQCQTVSTSARPSLDSNLFEGRDLKLLAGDNLKRGLLVDKFRCSYPTKVPKKPKSQTCPTLASADASIYLSVPCGL